MKTHIQIVAAVHIGFGVLMLLGAFTVFACIGLAGGIAVTQGDHDAAPILGIIAFVVAGFLAVLGLPGIIGGWALYTDRNWGRPLVLVLGVLHLMNIPIGTALGIYTLWALLREPQSPSTPQSPQPAF
jgi:hypothetical protein